MALIQRLGKLVCSWVEQKQASNSLSAIVINLLLLFHNDDIKVKRGHVMVMGEVRDSGPKSCSSHSSSQFLPTRALTGFLFFHLGHEFSSFYYGLANEDINSHR